MSEKHKDKKSEKQSSHSAPKDELKMVVSRIEVHRSVQLSRDFITISAEVGLAADVSVPIGDEIALKLAHSRLSAQANALANSDFENATGPLAGRVRDLVAAEAKKWKPGVSSFGKSAAAGTESDKDSDSDKKGPDSDNSSDSDKNSDSDKSSDSDKKPGKKTETKVTQAQVKKMKKPELKALIKLHALDLDPSEFDDIDELRTAVCDELFGHTSDGKGSDSDKKGSDSDKKSDSDSDKKGSDSDAGKGSDSDSDNKPDSD